MTKTQVRERLRDWIAQTSGKVRAEDVRDDTPILEQRLVTSLQIMDLILLIEELSERSVDVSQLKPGAFRDIDAICSGFFDGA